LVQDGKQQEMDNLIRVGGGDFKSDVVGIWPPFPNWSISKKFFRKKNYGIPKYLYIKILLWKKEL
jgi:hypothetical protein